MEAHQRSGEPVWDVPYLPIDPNDVGRTYEAIIRVNCQSGKGGVAYVLKHDHQLDLPRGMQVEFAQVVQRITDERGRRASPRPTSGSRSRREYLDREVPLELDGYRIASGDEGERIDAVDPRTAAAEHEVGAEGNGPLDAFVKARRATPPASRRACSTTTSTRSAPARTRARPPTCRSRSASRRAGASAVHHSIVTASLRAVVSAINRALAIA